MKIWAAFTILAIFLAVTPAAAADPLTVQILSVDEQAGRISATVNVVGGDGRPITGLGVPNFKGTLGDTPLAVSDLLGSSAARQGASVVLLVDVSGSMAGEAISQSKAAMQDFVRGLDPGDRVAIVLFGPQVTPLQDFTADRNVLNQAISRITVKGETALYDGVLAGLAKIAEAPPGRRMMVLLSDGSATINLGARASTLEAAAATGVSIQALGFGKDIDRAYLTELATASGGRFVPATAGSLRQIYSDIANAIRSQYTVVLSVPSTVDRTVPAKLKLQVTLRADTAVSDRDVGPLAGATVPPFDVKLDGMAAGQQLKTPATFKLTPKVAAGVSLAKVEYSLDGKPAQAVDPATFAYSFDSSPLAPGNHIINLVASDVAGRAGQAQVTFTVLAPAKSSPITMSTILLLLVALLAAFGIYTVVNKKRGQLNGIAGRVRPFARKSDEPLRQPIDGWPTPVPAPTTPLPPPADRPLGRVVVMDEAAVRNGNLDAIREYEIKSQPLTLGTGQNCDVRLLDEHGRIAAEEARLWVQKGRLVYHKLTTLSAMATEGVTSGWEFLESGEEMHLGAYRILFEEYTPDQVAHKDVDAVHPEEPLKPTQDHGMSLSDLWSRVAEDAHLAQPSDQAL